ncbi:amino acid adenylation domain-containing protein [Pseudoalteromonas sp. SMS1]|uniref:non-ribosomal peptide synthetase n=1 Tax=Pseudoalteromonas sp. SMS1 TaxID=2908894 RepID=UPI001F441E34|nr:non-ribosomal peptide synthetase [Pseudoalteromonas sp. SMS1]MCF2857589.1 amino acid adenylation domain-containing protein [Pseudoalteromonas sp. SMS1]
MIAKQLVYDLHLRNIIIQSEDNDLLITGDTDNLTEQDIEKLKACKADLLALFGQQNEGDLTFHSQVNSEQYEAPVSNLQQNIHFLESLSQEQNFYNVPVAFRLTGELEEAALTQAIAYLCERFHILRTVYQYKGSELVQIVEPFERAKVPFEVMEVPTEQLAHCLRQEADHNFDLAEQWPIRCVLLRSGDEQILSLNLHHIAIDGYSAKLIINALSEAYDFYHSSDNVTEITGEVFSAPQYADYALWHKAYLNSAACEEARKYWFDLLEGAPSCHNFPLEFARPSTMSVEGDNLSYQVEGVLLSKIKRFAKQKNVSTFLALQSLFAGFMARLGDESELVMSSVYANRVPSDFKNTIGMFANTIPFRYQFDENTDVNHLIESTRVQHQAALKYQQLPFEMMLEGLNIDRDPSYNPLVQMQFVLQEDAINGLALNALETEVISNRQAVAKFDFSVHVSILKESIKIDWEFNTNLFSRARIETLLDYYLAFVEHHVQSEFGKVLHYEFDLGDLQRPVSKADFNTYLSNPELIEQYATSQPDAIAVTDGTNSLTYRELTNKANLLISGLQQQGVSFGQRVAVYMDKSLNQVVTMYAMMRAGFVYVPLDPSYPAERLAYICDNSDAKVLIHATTQIPSAAIAGKITKADYDTLLAQGGEATLPTLTESDPAYIIYTSGSTGKPKGVVVPHGSIYYSLQANRKVYNYQTADIMPTVGSQAFGVSLLETFVPLVSGGTVKVLNKSDVTDINQLIERTQDVTVMHMVPSLMAQWLDQIESDQTRYPKLRLLLVGAEPVPPILLKRLTAWRADVVVRVLYGMTESSVVSSGYLSHEHDGNGYSVGKPHPNMKFYTMNRLGIVQPVGVSGELYVGGLSLAHGYVGLPELTDEKFIFNKRLNERLYKTGDRAKLLPTGHFEFMGRVDHQVSLRGIRIETGEIESLANQVDAVKKCIAHVVPLENGDSKFVLYYTVYDVDAKGDIEGQIKAVLAQSIPESMRPSVYVKLDAFPHNPNGKVDRNKLPKPTSQSSCMPPQSDTERYLHTLWCSMLELEQISIVDSFFELGGHSLMATKLINNINEHFEINLPLRRFFEASTIQQCGQVIDDEVETHSLSASVIKGDLDEMQGEVDEFVI